MRISDWSSDVCSSDLPEAAEALRNLIRLDVAVVILARPHEFAVPFERARDHVVDQAMLIFDAGFGEFAFEFTVEYFLKQILEAAVIGLQDGVLRSEEHTSELQSLMRISYAVFCFKKKNTTTHHRHHANNLVN